MSERYGNWMQTYSGRQYWPADPSGDDVYLEDIAHHLALTNRYCGATKKPYTVAEHSVHVSHLVERECDYHRMTKEERRLLTLLALLHDAPEAYVHDITRPLKSELGDPYRTLEKINAMAIASAFNLTDVTDPNGLIKLADNAILAAEMEAFMRAPPVPWEPQDVPERMVKHGHERIKPYAEPMTWCAAKESFLARYGELRA